jgi:DNA modification methylase
MQKDRTRQLNKYHLADARLLETVLDKTQVDVTITSPPYWDAKDYGSSKQIGFGQAYSEFLNDLAAVFDAVWKRTAPNGSLWLVVDTIKKKGRVHLLPFDIIQKLTERSVRAWFLQDILIWQKPHTLPWSHRTKLRGQFEYILCFSKSRDFRLNLDALRTTSGLANWWVKYPERYHPLGKALGNVWEHAIPTQGTWGNGHFAHSCPLPIEMAQRIVLLATSHAKQVVLDPFAGTGPVLLAANAVGRHWVGVDTSAKFREMFHRRLAHETPKKDAPKPAREFSATNLRLRQLKFGVQLFKRLAPSERLTTADIPVILVFGGRQVRTPSPDWITGCRVVLVASRSMTLRRRTQLRRAIENATQHAPFTKYQVAVTVTLASVEELPRLAKAFGKAKVYRYTQGHFWKGRYVGSEPLLKRRNIRLPDILSDIEVDERPAY